MLIEPTQSRPNRTAPLPLARLCIELENIAARQGLPGKDKSGTKAAPSRVASDGGEKTPHPAPSADVWRLALAELPNNPGGPFHDYKDWVDISHAIKGAAVMGGFDAEVRPDFIQWSLQFGGDPEEPGRVWDSITKPHVGWGPIMAALRAVNPAGAARVKEAENRVVLARDAAQNIAALMGAAFAPVTPFAATQIPPRRWLYGRAYIAGFVSFLVAPGGAGKSALAMVEAVAMASGRELLPGEGPVRSMRVWLHNAEDDLAEMQRRLAAVLLHFGLTYADLNGNLFMTSGREMKLQLARTGRDGPEIVPGMVDALVERLVAAKIDVLILDPLGALHTLPENSNEAANLLSGALREVAHRADVAVMVLHHAGKAAAMDMDAAGAGASRGASAFVDAARVVRQVIRMTVNEADRYGIAEADRRDYLRVENGKANLARAEGGRWLHMVDVPLGNGMGLWPLGDRVGVVERWTPKPTTGTASDLGRVQAAISSTQTAPRYSPKSVDWVGYMVADALGLNIGPVGANKNNRTAEETRNHAAVREMLDSWFRDGGLIRQKARDPKTRHEVDVVGIGRPAILTDETAADAAVNADAPDADMDAENARRQI